MNRHNLPLAWHVATDMSATGWVMIANSSNCLISPGWLASIAEGDSIINATLLYFTLLKRHKQNTLLLTVVCKVLIHSGIDGYLTLIGLISRDAL